MISAKIIADSVNPAGDRLVSFIITYPRFVLAEINTHRMLSRNSASSRAIPVGKMLAAVLHGPAGPVVWGKNQSGMQAAAELEGWRLWAAKKLWKLSSLTQVGFAWLLNKLGVHKQITNRLIEPFATMTTLVSGTEWGNFFNLRAHRDAQPEFQELAYSMLQAYVDSVPSPLQAGQWHLPFAGRYTHEGLSEAQLLKIATARAARLSYLTFDNEISHEKDYDLHDRLLASGHMSPFEHAARALGESRWCGNFRGFFQYRKTLPRENRVEFDPHAILAGRPQR